MNERVSHNMSDGAQHTFINSDNLTVGGVAQRLERRSLTGELSLIYA